MRTPLYPAEADYNNYNLESPSHTNITSFRDCSVSAPCPSL